MDAQAVIEQMVQRYVAFRCYSDTGQVTFTHPNFVTKTPFSTHYSAPSLFRFDFTVPHPHPPLSHVTSQHAVGFDGAKAYAIRKQFRGGVETESCESTGLAIAGAAAISCGAALTIGRLLFTDTGAVSLLEQIDAHFDDDDTVLDDIDCYSIAVRYPNNQSRYKYHIEKGSFLLRKLLSEHRTSSFEESRTNIRINEPIEGELFAATLRKHAA
jgi:hypothetical protein